MPSFSRTCSLWQHKQHQKSFMSTCMYSLTKTDQTGSSRCDTLARLRRIAHPSLAKLGSLQVTQAIVDMQLQHQAQSIPQLAPFTCPFIINSASAGAASAYQMATYRLQPSLLCLGQLQLQRCRCPLAQLCCCLSKSLSCTSTCCGSRTFLQVLLALTISVSQTLPHSF